LKSPAIIRANPAIIIEKIGLSPIKDVSRFIPPIAGNDLRNNYKHIENPHACTHTIFIYRT
jgi:hypothetical protein